MNELDRTSKINEKLHTEVGKDLLFFNKSVFFLPADDSDIFCKFALKRSTLHSAVFCTFTFYSLIDGVLGRNITGVYTGGGITLLIEGGLAGVFNEVTGARNVQTAC